MELRGYAEISKWSEIETRFDKRSTEIHRLSSVDEDWVSWLKAFKLGDTKDEDGRGCV